MVAITSGLKTAFPQDQNLHTFLFSNPLQHHPNHFADRYPDHTFDATPIPEQRPILVHDGTGAQLSWARLRADSLRLARSLQILTGAPAAFVSDPKRPREPIHAPRTTVLLHIPNGMVWPLVALGTVAANLTVCPISTYLSPRELAYILAKARPQVLFTTVGAEGELPLRKALQLLLDSPPTDNGQVKAAEIQAWARQLARDWDESKAARLEKSNQVPFLRRRVWTVDVSSGMDYYGNNVNRHGVASAYDPRDWTHLLLPPPGTKGEGSIASLDRPAFTPAPMTPEEQQRRIAFVLWSSGTTGQSKGVLISHRALVSNTLGVWDTNPHFSGTSRGANGGGERWITLAPWYHVYGLATVLLPTVAFGTTLIIPASPKFDLGYYLGLVTRYRATFSHIAPAVAVALRSCPHLDPAAPQSKGIDLSSIAAFLTGGAPVPVEVVRKVYERTGKYIQLGYGTTETCSTSQTGGLGLDADGKVVRDELGSAGFPCPNTDIQIRPLPGTSQQQSEHRQEEIRAVSRQARARGERAPLNPGVVGEVLIRAPAVMSGYFSGLSSETHSALDVELTAGAFTDDGWYRSGDEGCLDANGRLWITGRTKELIKVKGFQVPPAELDDLFATHPELVDAAATGFIEDASTGEEQVLLLVVPKDKSALSQEAKMHELAHRLHTWVGDKTAYYKWPSWYLFAESAPRNPTGKLLRKDIAASKGHRVQIVRQSRKVIAPGAVAKL
ncbi:AMP-dependent synthetase/ligase [Kalmanozyma brasiliensis GHG001]|uniref:AMP-dependent synthetase/ligase domain-containing protein n=1 Tax=Kalmanozyma brasiliensis (strain GHG001) TaxID=1365824 RepID=V5F057_KALBG|nr:AMP-dependent synthetase/ligase [Kalmanozyma brasiliensis GHG001]EST09648.1 AMP-dependent synthetase/ligase [Kalmanozyma brasiliensis GHG001]